MADHVALSTQERNPRSAVIRTVFAAIVTAFPLVNATLLIVKAELAQYAVDLPGWVFVTLNVGLAVTAAFTAIVTRVLAIPGVNDWLRRYFPLLAPEDHPKPEAQTVNGL